jgi:peptide/nickel transport system substrate-binding protein
MICLLLLVVTGCRDRSDTFVMALETKEETLNPLRGSDASSDRFRQLMFNTLVRKNEKFDYVGDLAENIQVAEDRLSVTFTLRPNVTFHDGKPLTARDAKYTLDTLLGEKSVDFKKSPPFFEGQAMARQAIITSVEAIDERNLVVRLRRPWNDLLANLTPIAIIPDGSIERQENNPIGTGAFKFVSRDASQNLVDLEAHEGFWQGAPNIKKLRVRVVLDANTLQAELQSGRVDLVVSASNLTPDAYTALERNQALQVKQFPGANVVYLGFNTQADIVKDARVRQAIGYAINREEIVKNLLLGQARIAHSILPEGSWAYTAGEQYNFDPARAKRILDEAGYPDPDGDGSKMRFPSPLVFKMSSASATRQYGGVIQNQLQAVGIPVAIETQEQVSLVEAQKKGQYQLTTSRWVGGNQDPIFLRDLFTSKGNYNRSGYKNQQLDEILDQAITLTDRDQAKRLYTQAQETISRELPMFPLWNPATMIIARQGVDNFQVDPSGDWSFVSKLRVN